MTLPKKTRAKTSEGKIKRIMRYASSVHAISTKEVAKRYGIMQLISAFYRINSGNYRLWICGSGNAEDEIKSFVEIDRRITYWGELANSEVRKLQKRATVLVNPRMSAELFTKYSFPSKIIEYLASGTPTISYRLAGIPDEYFDYCFVPDREDEDGLKQCIIDVCEMTSDELSSFGSKAKDFITKNKNPRAQAERIIEMITSQ